jgi:hypothetical protein
VKKVWTGKVTDKFRLIVYKGKKILLDKFFRTLRGAKIAFSKIFNKYAFKEGVMASWSIFIRGDLKSLKPPLCLYASGINH